ncbi:molybdenum cofactor guanylyltransferase [Sphingomonas mesophila]|uniref:molybdenum cofactor guanylyltransferase n=1 Tax=Sphingomonas mesophila TaxID=2303576 RepID=UPI000E5923A3|nr:molybdenum cofactor guanylyltransferase [Sphingomonas mesophila]
MTNAVVVLAGGSGSRIGGGKPLRLLGGRRLIDRALSLAALWSPTVAVAVRDQGQVAPLAARCIADVADIEGPLAGLASALRFGTEQRAQTVLTIPADMPFLPVDLAERLAEALGELDCAMAASEGRAHPVCALWRTTASAALPDYLATGQRSLRGFAQALGAVVVDWPVENGDPFININSAGDLAAAESLLASQNAST